MSILLGTPNLIAVYPMYNHLLFMRDYDVIFPLARPGCCDGRCLLTLSCKSGKVPVQATNYIHALARCNPGSTWID